jgi:AcrR family transcriptional regulator
LEEKPKSTRSQRLKESSQQRRTQEKLNVRLAIIEAASELFLETGYERFSLRQVAERLGYSPGTLYLYFQDKDDLLFTLMNDGVVKLNQALRNALTNEDLRQRLYAMSKAYVDFGLENPSHYQLMFMQRPDFILRQGAETPTPMLEIFGMWQGLVEEAMREGVLRMGNPVSTCDAFWSLLHGVVSLAILMPVFDAKRIEEMVNTSLEMIVTGIHKA